MKKIEVCTLLIEVTRKCNMECLHCLRGDAQNKNIKLSYIDEMLKQLRDTEIGTLIITGGEPSLNVPAIRFILDKLKEYNIDVIAFYMVTNGSKSSMNKKFIDVCMELYRYQNMKASDSDFLPLLAMSDDKYHDDRWHDEVIRELSVYKFFELRNDSERDESSMIAQVRALDYLDGCRELRVYPWSLDECNDTILIEGDVYLNAEGDLTTCCDLSYENQTDEAVCHVTNFTTYVNELYNTYQNELETAD